MGERWTLLRLARACFAEDGRHPHPVVRLGFKPS